MTTPDRCMHEHIAGPPPGRHLRICLDCCSRLIECSSCDAKITARPDIANSGWTSGGGINEFGERFEWTYCPEHSP